MVYDKPKHKNDLKPGNRWGLPGGKCCDDKLKTHNCCTETPEKTAIREFLEETGYIAKVELLYSDELLHPESREKFVRHTYLGSIVGGRQSITKFAGSIISPHWFKLGAFPRNSHKSHQHLIGRYFGIANSKG